MAVARLVSLFESKSLLPTSSHPSTAAQHTDSFATRSLRSSPIMTSSEEATCHISIQPYHFSSRRASRQRYYDGDSSNSPVASPSSSYRSRPYSFRSHSPMSSGQYTPTRTRSTQLRLRRIPNHINLVLAAERDDQGLQLLEPRPVAATEAACVGRSASPEVLLDGIFEVLEGR